MNLQKYWEQPCKLLHYLEIWFGKKLTVWKWLIVVCSKEKVDRRLCREIFREKFAYFLQRRVFGKQTKNQIRVSSLSRFSRFIYHCQSPGESYHHRKCIIRDFPRKICIFPPAGKKYFLQRRGQQQPRVDWPGTVGRSKKLSQATVLWNIP